MAPLPSPPQAPPLTAFASSSSGNDSSDAGGSDTSLVGNAVIYDTKLQKFVPAEPQAYLAAALKRYGTAMPRVFFAVKSTGTSCTMLSS